MIRQKKKKPNFKTIASNKIMFTRSSREYIVWSSASNNHGIAVAQQPTGLGFSHNKKRFVEWKLLLSGERSKLDYVKRSCFQLLLAGVQSACYYTQLVLRKWSSFYFAVLLIC